MFEKPRHELTVLPDFKFQLITLEFWSALTVTHLKIELLTLFHNDLLFPMVRMLRKPNLWIALKLLKQWLQTPSQKQIQKYFKTFKHLNNFRKNRFWVSLNYSLLSKFHDDTLWKKLVINYWVSPWKNRALFSNSALGFLFWLLQSKVVSNLEVS